MDLDFDLDLDLDLDIDLPGESGPREKIDRHQATFFPSGNIWALGNHRLACASSMSGWMHDRAEMVFTDPPFDMGWRDIWKSIESTGARGWLVMCGMRQASNLATHDPFGFSFEMVWHFGQCRSVGQQYVPFQTHNMIVVGGKHSFVRKLSRGSFSKTGAQTFVPSVIYAPHTMSQEHGHMKNLEQTTNLLRCFADTVIADPFCGSGTTLLACEELRKVCYAIELSPEFCKLIIGRWEEMTGKKAVLLETRAGDCPKPNSAYRTQRTFGAGQRRSGSRPKRS